MATDYSLISVALLPLCLFISIANLIIVDGLKAIIGRHRPHQFARRNFNVRSLVSNHAMPSGDSAQAAVWASLLYCHTGSPLALFIVPCVMFARIFFGAHWFGDTIVGACVGAAVSLACRSLLGWMCLASMAGRLGTGTSGLSEFCCMPVM